MYNNSFVANCIYLYLVHNGVKSFKHHEANKSRKCAIGKAEINKTSVLYRWARAHRDKHKQYHRQPLSREGILAF